MFERLKVATLAIACCAIMIALTLHVVRVLAPPILTPGAAVVPVRDIGFIDTYAIGSGADRPIPRSHRVALPIGSRLSLRGWTAASVDPVILAQRVSVSVDGHVLDAPFARLARPDVATVMAHPALVDSGYRIAFATPRRRGSYTVRVIATANGDEWYSVGTALTVIIR